MKAVILAAGEGIRMRPLTIEKPKPMLELAGKPIIYHIFSTLPSEIKEVILVIGYKGEQIKDYLSDTFQNKKIRYVWQKEKKGTAHALLLCRRYLKNGKFLLLYGDDLHGKRGIQNCLKYDLAILVSESKNPERFGVVNVGPDNHIINIEEKPEKPKSNLVSTGVLVLDQRIFKYRPKRHPNGEYYITTVIDKLIRDHKVIAQKASFWFPIGYPKDLKKAEKLFYKNNKIY